MTLWVAVKAALRGFLGVLQLQAVATLGFDWIFLRSIPNASFQLDELNRSLKARIGFERAIYRLLGTLFTIGFSLLPLSSLLVALPMVSPTEAVLTETIRPTNSWWRRTARRALAGLAGLAVLVVLLAFAVEIVSHFPIASGGQLGTLAKKVLGYSVADFVPNDIKPSEPKMPEAMQDAIANLLHKPPDPSQPPSLSKLLVRREKARKELLERELTRESQEKFAADLAAANSAIARWADEPKNQWMIPPELLASWRSFRDAPASPVGPVDQALWPRIRSPSASPR